MSKQLRKTPSELYRIDPEDEVTCWAFDRAVQTFGNALENRLHEVSAATKGKQAAERKTQRELDKWLNSGDDKSTSGRFRDPMKL